MTRDRGVTIRALIGLVLALVVVGGCTFEDTEPTRPRSVTLDATQAAEIDFTGGRYRFTWDAGDCTGFYIRIVPLGGGTAIEVPVTAATGTTEIDIPAIKAGVDRGGTCPSGKHTVTIERL